MAVVSPALVRPRHRRRRVLLAVLVLLMLWLAVGFLRAPEVATDYLARIESPKGVSQVTASAFPGIPPFWIVTVQGTVTEPSGATYAATQIVWVELVTGWVLTFAAG
jgi:hypothetical protein